MSARLRSVELISIWWRDDSGETKMRVAGLFSGIGGIEEGFHRAGLSSELLCEVDESARSVLQRRFSNVLIERDIRKLRSLPKVAVLAAGFPCQDLSQAGRLRGITGRHSSLIGEVFRLLGARRSRPEWLVLENVPFMLHLAGGEAMHVITSALEDAGYRWAYRVVDAMAFGLPQRRRRIIIVGSRREDPRGVLFCDDAGERVPTCRPESPRGFYWTEGRSGLGWALNAVPPLKSGSSVGIPSSPAIWFPDQRLIGTLNIRDAERLQGFRAGWTQPAAEDDRSQRGRWRLVGNAVSVPMAEWVARRLLRPGNYDASEDVELGALATWPRAAWGGKGRAYAANVSSWPIRAPSRGLRSFLRHAVVPLSARATAGFRSRALESSLRFEEGFLEDLAHHMEIMRFAGNASRESKLAA